MVIKKQLHVLIIKTSSMGDVIHTLPALTDAKELIPNIAFDWVVEQNFAQIPSWHPAVAKVIPINLRSWRKNLLTLPVNLWRFRQKLKKTRYDLVIDAQGLIKSGLISSFARGKKYGYDFTSARENIAAIFYQHRLNVDKQQHAVTRIRELFAKALGYKLPSTAPDYGIKANFNKPTIKNYLVFLHSTARKEKLWPEENWLALAKALPQYQIKLPWGNKNEHARAKRLSQAADNFIVLPKSNLSELAEVLLGAKAVVAVDTGLGHLCAALEVPTISIYEATNPKLVGTLGLNQQQLTNTAAGNVLSCLKQLLQ